MWCLRKLSILWCQGCIWDVEGLRGKMIRKGKKKRILKSMVAQSEKRIYGHKRKSNDNQNALFSHMLELKHTFNFSQATLIKPINCKKSRTLLESVVISKTNHIKWHPGFNQMSPYMMNIILNENKIKIENWLEKKKKKGLSLSAAILLRILSFCLSLSFCLLAFPHSNYNLHTTI